MKTTFTVLYPNNSAATHEVDLPGEPSYDDIKKVLKPWFDSDKGVWFEQVRVLDEEDVWADMFVDGDGRARGLPYNIAASGLYRGTILGPAVVFSRKVWF